MAVFRASPRMAVVLFSVNDYINLSLKELEDYRVVHLSVTM